MELAKLVLDLPGGIALDFSAEAKIACELSIEVAAVALRPEAQHAPAIPIAEANTRLINLGFQPSPSGLTLDYYRNLARQDPNIALAGLRIEVDVRARNLAKGFHLAVTDRDTGTRLFRRLLEDV